MNPMQEHAEVLRYTSQDGVATITIHRPERLNAIDAAVERALAAAWRHFNARDEDRVAVLTGAGDRAFSAGRDKAATEPPDYRRFTPGVVIEVDKPVIAAVAGWCVGGALVLVQMCDLCVAAENARFVYPEAKMGFAGGLIGSLPGRIPHKIAMELMLLGEEVSAQRAYEVGFVNRLVPVGRQVEEAQAMARRMAAHAPLVMTMLKRFANDVLPKGPVERSALALRETEAVFGSADFAEGLASLREQRTPRFEGR
ncbi:enoyl-CoA hydratase/isomerase family protein [Piscinibacter sakaiensis]|uniref:Enoyl-CoA hydratase n=1 Tax=Piscinibacter sakaiensis TaxID=1547922 RepID=A0A0K8P709_PISS1|nr:enoyl-CoA hydratase/isomerase family protein [Piscinibacter sakaiensis]GAP38005.1 enoyl-CoA hydratase [Piscinibacter sakaiensis]